MRVVFPLSWPHNISMRQHINHDKPITVTPPTQDFPKDHPVRREIIALHLAVTVGGAEFYPFCTEFETTSPNQTASILGAYTYSDPSIYYPIIYIP